MSENYIAEIHLKANMEGTECKVNGESSKIFALLTVCFESLFERAIEFGQENLAKEILEFRINEAYKEAKKTAERSNPNVKHLTRPGT